MYSGDTGGFFTNPDARFGPLNGADIPVDGRVYACPSASRSRSQASNTAFDDADVEAPDDAE